MFRVALFLVIPLRDIYDVLSVPLATRNFINVAGICRNKICERVALIYAHYEIRKEIFICSGCVTSEMENFNSKRIVKCKLNFSKHYTGYLSLKYLL